MTSAIREQPETVAQAAAWDRAKVAYLTAGLCPACAAQLAWGHQQGVGFTTINPPCPRCNGHQLPPAATAKTRGLFTRGQRWLGGPKSVPAERGVTGPRDEGHLECGSALEPGQRAVYGFGQVA